MQNWQNSDPPPCAKWSRIWSPAPDNHRKATGNQSSMRKSPRHGNGRAVSAPRSTRAASSSSNELQDIWLGLSESFGEPKKRKNMTIRPAWKEISPRNGDDSPAQQNGGKASTKGSNKSRQKDALACSPIALGDARHQGNFERALHEHLHKLQQLLLFRNAVLLGHSADVVGDYVEKMAQETLEMQLTLAINERVRLEGPKSRHRLTAYESVSKDLLESVRAAIASDEYEHLKNMQEACRRETAIAQQRQLQAEQALQSRDRDVQKFEQQCEDLRATIRQMEDGKAVLQNEVDKALNEQFRFQQQLVELRIQTYNLSLDLQRRCTNVLNSVQSRMGFVPSTIQHEIDNLLSLQPQLES